MPTNNAPEPNPVDALLIVDPQNDFCSGGALAVPDADSIFANVNRLAAHFSIVIASKDWHPVGHSSFQTSGGPWPVHCLQGTRGAAFHDALDASKIQLIIETGTDIDIDGYSAFASTRLAQELAARNVTRLIVCGLATDYCVRASVLDALQQDLDTVVVTDAMAAVNVSPGDGQRALEEMHSAGARLTTTAQLLEE